MQEDRVPKVFISYSWSSDTLVLPLAERLVAHGVDVVLDKWDLKEGQDKYAFMEQCVNDPEITKVLIVCDKAYMDKANSRTGGVGDETVIISDEIYGKMNQDKFIPVVAEHDEKGKACVPTYIRSRIYIDLSNEDSFEEEYEKLVRNIYEKPVYRKPKLGIRPEWLDDQKTDLFLITDLVRQIKGAKTAKKQESCVKRFADAYINTLKTYYNKHGDNGEQVYTKFVELKAVRDVYLNFLSALSETELSFPEIICESFEKMYNTLTCAKGFDSDASSATDRSYEIYHIFIWELFIAVIAFLRHIEDYKTLNAIVTNTFFLTQSCLDDSIHAMNYCAFYHYCEIIEEGYKQTTDNKNKYTLLGHMICTEREKLPIYSKEALAEADLFLYQIKNALPIFQPNDPYVWCPPYWFPILYVYVKRCPIEWIKMKSRKYCVNKMYDLFGVSSLEKLKEAVSKCVYDREMCYRGGFPRAAPTILTYIKVEDIGSLI